MPNVKCNILALISFGVATGFGCGGSVEEPPELVSRMETPSLPSLPIRSPEFLQASRAFGPLIVHPTLFAEAASSKVPWSGYWYPVQYKEMWEGTPARPSPLQKYDEYVAKAHGQSSQAVAFEREHLFSGNAASWEGLCNGWAFAALAEPEPRLVRPITLDGVTFNTGDLKALLMKTYEKIDGVQQFGQRNRGGALSVYEDIYPDQFHRVVQSELFGKRRAFMMDKDPDLPVWNTPVWKAQMKIERDASDPRVFHVKTWLFGADPHVESYDFAGTLAVTFQYTYDLYGYPTENGGLSVEYGVWTADSIEYHPDFIATLPDSPNQVLSRGTKNSQVNITVVDEILRRAVQAQ